MSRKFTGSQAGQDGVRMREDDGNPDAHGVSEVIVTNGTLTALGNGIVELSTGGGGGGTTGATGPPGATGQAFLTVSDVSGNTGPYSGITTLKFDDTTGLDIAPTAANEVTVSIGSHWYSILVDGQTTLTPSGAQNIEFIAGTGMQIITDNTSNPVSYSMECYWKCRCYGRRWSNWSERANWGARNNRSEGNYGGAGNYW